MGGPSGIGIRFGVLVVGVMVMLVGLVAGDTIKQGTGSEYIAFEAESADSITDTVGTSPPDGNTWVPMTLAGASGGVALGTVGWNQDEAATYNLMFDSAGTYEFYIRFGVYDTSWSGIGDGSNDSFFRPSDFNIVVPPEVSVAVALVYPWDWRDYGTYTVSAGQVGTTQTFAIGTREAGFTADRLIFSKTSGLTATELDPLANSEVVANAEVPEPATLTLLGLGGLALLRRRRAK